VHDKLGVIGQTEFSGIYAYRIPVSINSSLSFGIQAGLSRYNAQYTQLDLPSTSPPDPMFSQDIIQTRPNIGAGVYYKNPTWYAGLSMPHMLNNVFSRGAGQTTVKQSFPIILTGGYLFPVYRSMRFKPTALVKMVDNRIVEVDVNANVLFDQVLWAGLSYHSSNAISILMNFQLNDQLRFGYSYTIALGKIKTVEVGSHELFVGYLFKRKDKKTAVSADYF
jgi:type IX secretion system PorP/SprF family membrane protein